MSAEMQTWTYPDVKRLTGPGPWEREPDKAQWVDEATGFDCLIVRGPAGALCGYVGVPSTHPLHGEDYEVPNVAVHGGLTFAAACDERETDGTKPQICHVPLPGRPGAVWWFGFDCAHVGDLTACGRGSARRFPSLGGGTYRDLEYVRSECTDLAKQLRDLEGGLR